MLRPLLLVLLGLPFFASCSTLGLTGNRPVDLVDVPSVLARTQELVDARQPLPALDQLERIHRTRNLTGLDRERADMLLSSALEAAFSGLVEGRFDARDMTDIFKLDLPSRARARAGIEAACELYRTEHPVAAFKMTRKVENALPAHSERARAGDLLAQVGFELVDNLDSYYLLFSYRTRGIEALEFLVSRYPFHNMCEEAYRRLAVSYEDEGDLDRAIERLSDLLVYHPETKFRAESEAHLAALRIRRLTSDHYDRGELKRARTELETWLARHDGHAQTEQVKATLELANRRLSRSDLVLANYYARLEETYAVRLHAQRALSDAERGGAVEEAEEARELLDRFPAVGAVANEPINPIELDDIELTDPLGPVLGS